MNQTPSHSFVNDRIRGTLKAFIRAVLPEDADLSPETEARLTEHFVETLHYVPETAQLPFKAGLWSLEFGSIVMGRGFCRFTKLSEADQRIYVGRWAHHSVFLLRDFFKALKGFAMLAYYELPELMQALEYDPQGYIDELKKNDSYQRQ